MKQPLTPSSVEVKMTGSVPLHYCMLSWSAQVQHYLYHIDVGGWSIEHSGNQSDQGHYSFRCACWMVNWELSFSPLNTHLCGQSLLFLIIKHSMVNFCCTRPPGVLTSKARNNTLLFLLFRKPLPNKLTWHWYSNLSQKAVLLLYGWK